MKENLKAYKPGNCEELAEKVIDLRSVFKIECPGLNDIGRQVAIKRSYAEYGEDKLKKMSSKAQWAIYNKNFPKSQLVTNIKYWILELTASVNVKQSLSEYQVDQTAASLYKMHNWKATDLILFFRNIKHGLYGGLYENLSQDKICEWARLYLYDRASVAEQISENDIAESKKIPKLSQEIIDKLFAGVGEKESPEILEKKESVFQNSEKGFRSYLKNVFSASDTISIFEVFIRWELRNDLLFYCDDIISALEARGLKDDYKVALDICNKIFKMRNDLPDKISEDYFNDIQELRKKLSKFIHQNKTDELT